MAGEAEIRSDMDAAWQRVTLPSEPDEVLFDLSGWRALQLGLQRSTLREAIHVLRRELRDINGQHIERAVWLAREGGTGQSATSAGLGCRSAMTACGLPARENPGRYAGASVRERCPARARGDAPRRRLAGDRGRAAGEVSVDSLEQSRGKRGWTPRLWGCVFLRPRAPGERFQPQGLGGHSVKLNEFMIDRKVHRDDRAGWPLLEGENGLAWVCGLRLDERAAVGRNTEAVARVFREGEAIKIATTGARRRDVTSWNVRLRAGQRAARGSGRAGRHWHT